MENKWLGLTASLCAAALFYVLITHFKGLQKGFYTILGYFTPVILGIILAYVINPLANLFQNRVFFRVKSEKHRRTLAVLFAIVTLIVFIVLLLIALIPQIIDSIVTFVSNIDSYANTLQGLLKRLEEYTKTWNIDISSLINMGDDLLENVSSTLPGNINRILNTSYSIGMSVFNGVISFILAIYFLGDKNRFVVGIRRLMQAILPGEKYTMIADFWNRCNDILIHFVIYDLLDGLIIGMANLVFHIVTGIPYGIMISTVVGVTNLAPTFGPILGAIIGAFILVLINPWYALWFLIFTIILQTIDGYILKPKLFGGLMGVPDVWILICIIVGGRMFGVPGILLSIPFAAISDFIYDDWITQKENSRKSPEESESSAAVEGNGEANAKARRKYEKPDLK